MISTILQIIGLQLEHLTVGQNNFGNKIPFLQMQTVFCEEMLEMCTNFKFQGLLWTISTLLKNLASSLGGTTESGCHET